MIKDFQLTFDLLKKNDRLAQKAVYNMYSAKMLAIANSYLGNREDAEEVLLTSFFKAFTQIQSCNNSQAFSAWLRRIVVNGCIDQIRKNKKNIYFESEGIESIADEILDTEIESEISEVNIEELLSKMPNGYRVVFNLYLFEEKKHREIAEMLGISEGSSKSQLSKAKKWLSEFIKNKKNEQFVTK